MKPTVTNTEITLFDNNNSKYDPSIFENVRKKGSKLNLNDLWKAAGSPENKDPKQWKRLPDTESFFTSACKILNVGKSHLIESASGKGGGTWGVRQVLLEYAQYLDSDLAVLVNEVFFQRIAEEKNPDLIVDRAISTYKKKGRDDKWIAQRLKTKGTRNEFTSCLAAHGVDKDGFRNCTNAIYTPLYGGTTAVVREKKHLPTKVNIRDNMSMEELCAVEFAEMLSRNKINANHLNGNGQCELACSDSSKQVANLLIQSKKSNKIAAL
jgi:hypothetical protein